MEWVETTGKSIEEALEAALDELGVDEQDAEFEVIEEPKVGLFGRVRSEGRIRARVRPTTPRAKEDRRDRRRRSKSADAGSTSEPAEGSSTDEADATVDGSASNGAPRNGRNRRATGERGPRPQPAPDAAEPVAAAPGAPEDGGAGPTGPRTNPSRRRSGGRASTGTRTVADDDGAAAVDATDGDSEQTSRPERPPRAPRQRTRAAKARPADDDRTDEGEDTLMDVALDEQGKVAEQFLVGLLERFGRTASITSTQPDDDTIDLQLEGDDLGLLIGPKGATLLAIQDLTRSAVQRKTGAGNGRIHIDVGGYRQKRSEALARFAQKVAADVTASQTRIALEPMNAPDRKVVHDALTDVEGVQTISEGEDPQRRVVILPVGA